MNIPTDEAHMTGCRSIYEQMRECRIVELTAQLRTAESQLAECKAFIETFPGQIVAARLDAKEGKETKYDYARHGACCGPSLPNYEENTP